jgi:hypothetical protein
MLATDPGLLHHWNEHGGRHRLNNGGAGSRSPMDLFVRRMILGLDHIGDDGAPMLASTTVTLRSSSKKSGPVYTQHKQCVCLVPVVHRRPGVAQQTRYVGILRAST